VYSTVVDVRLAMYSFHIQWQMLSCPALVQFWKIARLWLVVSV